MRLGCLHINSLYNVPVKYEYIKNVNLSEMVSYKGKRAMFKEMILLVKQNRSKLFIAVEKGIEKHKDSAFLLIKPTLRMVAHEWIRDNLNKEFKFETTKERRCSVRVNETEEVLQYQEELKQYINENLAE